MALTALDYYSLTIFGEARGEPIEGRIAVAAVIRNRLRAGHWGASYEAVCLAPHQFSCWQRVGGHSNYDTLKALEQQIEQGQRPSDPVLTECYAIAQEMVSGRLQDNTTGGTHYMTTALFKAAPPLWAKELTPLCVIGSHVFFVA